MSPRSKGRVVQVTLRDEDIRSHRIGSLHDPRIARTLAARGKLGAPSSLRPSRPRTLHPALRETLAIPDAEAFLTQRWQRAPWQGRVEPGGFDRLFSMEILDRLLSSRELRWDRVRLMDTSAGTRDPRLERRLSALDRVPDLRSASLIIHDLAADWPPLRALLHQAELSFGTLGMSFAVLTPPRSQHLDLHWDPLDGFVLQISGRKRWRIYEPLVTLPMEAHESKIYAFAPGRLVLDTVLEAGSVLYVPRGFLHEVHTEDEHSLHVNIAVFGVQWHRLVATVWRHALAAAASSATLAGPCRGAADEAAGASPRRASALLAQLWAAARPSDYQTFAEDASYCSPNEYVPATAHYQPGSILAYRAQARRPRGRARTVYTLRPLRHTQRRTAGGTLLVFEDSKVLVEQGSSAELAHILTAQAFSPEDRPRGVELKRLTTLAETLTRAGFLSRRTTWRPT